MCLSFLRKQESMGAQIEGIDMMPLSAFLPVAIPGAIIVDCLSFPPVQE